MQRFYQAVELDEAEMTRKRGSSIDMMNKISQFGQQSEEEDNEVLSGNEAKNEAEAKLKSDRLHDWEYENDRKSRKEIFESQHKLSNTPCETSEDIAYDDDYTESTASSTHSISIPASVESIEDFITSVRLASTNSNMTAINTRSTKNDELETYHPSMEVRALSPYRTPEPGQATIILNKPVPLPDPDIKPKSILKRRSSNENNGNETIIANTNMERKIIEKEIISLQLQQEQQPQSQSKSLSSTPKLEKEKRSFLNMFSKKATSVEISKNPPIELLPEKAAEKEQMLKFRQNSIEENKVEQVAVIDHYSDIVRELGGKPHSTAPVPIYMNHHALREAAARAELEEREQLRQRQSQNVDNEDVKRMLEVAEKINLYTESTENLNDSETHSSPMQKDLVEISVERTNSVSFSVRQLNQPDVIANNETTILQANAKCMTESTKLRNEGDKSNSFTDTLKKETLTEMKSSSSSCQLGRKSISERGQSKSERKTSLSSTVLKVTRMPIQNNNDIDIVLESSSHSPSPEPWCTTHEKIKTSAELNVRSTLSYTTDLVMFLLACYLYIFRDARLSIPILILIMYRHVRNAFVNKIHKWTKRKRE